MLDSRFRLQRISHQHTLHLCKATLTVCTSDLIAPDLQGTIGFFENPDSCCLQFSCNQEGPLATKKTCLVSMIWSQLQQTLRVDHTCYRCCRLWCRLLSTTASCSSWKLQVNWISTARFPSFRPRHSVDSESQSKVTESAHAKLSTTTCSERKQEFTESCTVPVYVPPVDRRTKETVCMLLTSGSMPPEKVGLYSAATYEIVLTHSSLR